MSTTDWSPNELMLAINLIYNDATYSLPPNLLRNSLSSDVISSLESNVDILCESSFIALIKCNDKEKRQSNDK